MWQPTQSSLSNCAGEKRWVYLLLNKTTCLALRQEEGWNWRGEQRAGKRRRKSSPRSLFTTGMGDWKGLDGSKLLQSWQISQEWFRKLCCHTWGRQSFIWDAVLRLLTTSSNWLIFSQLSRSQPHCLSCVPLNREVETQKVLGVIILMCSPLPLICPSSFFFLSFNYVYNLPFLCYFENLDLFPISSPTGRFSVLTVSC